MTASTSRLVVFVAALLGACRPGLPPDPPAADPANPDAPIGRPTTTPDTFVRSAFEGEKLDEGGGHEHHGAHGGHAMPKQEEAHAHEHGEHGTKRP